MRPFFRMHLWLCMIVTMLAACNQPAELTPAITVTPSAETAALSTVPPTFTTQAETAIPAATSTTEPLPTNTAVVYQGVELALIPNRTFIYPSTELHVGDQATFQLYAQVPDNILPNQVPVEIAVDGRLLASGVLGSQNLAGEAYGLFEWVWEVGAELGVHEVVITLDPHNVIVSGDADELNNKLVLPVSVAGAMVGNARGDAGLDGWVSAETTYTNLFVVPGSAAHRDLTAISAEIDNALRDAYARLNLAPSAKLNLYFSDRIIGQGGYAGEDMVISYVDRDYAGAGFRELLFHESIHIIDDHFTPPSNMPFLVEGLAVWAVGGHYKPENLDKRMAALVLGTESYLPLTQLIDDFYPAQHEISYLEAGGFFQYLVNRFGQERVMTFYSTVNSAEELTKIPSEAMDIALRSHFGFSLTQLEADWIQQLRAISYDTQESEDLMLTVAYYDMMRRYQQQHDPTAYYLNAWLPSPRALYERNSSAELSRHPTAEINIWLETMLVAANQALRTGQYSQARALLSGIERTLNNPLTSDPLSSNYLQLVQLTADYSLESHRIIVEGTHATVFGTLPDSTNLVTLAFTQASNHQWSIVE